MNTKKQVLEGHKRVKSRFVPPMMQLPNLRETSYINELLPHVVWMSLLNDKLGLEHGIKRSFQLAKLAHKIHVSEKHVNFAVCGNYSKLTESEAAELVTQLDKQGLLNTYRDALAPLLHLHPNCPMHLLGLPSVPDDRQALVDRLRRAIDIIFERYETPAAIMHANLITIRASTAGLFVAKHIEIPDFDALIRDPESEAAKRAASFARSCAMQEFMPDDEQRLLEWPKSFWNANYRLDACAPLEASDE